MLAPVIIGKWIILILMSLFFSDLSHSLRGKQRCKEGFLSVQNLSLRMYAMSLGVQVGYVNYSILWAYVAQTGLVLLVPQVLGLLVFPYSQLREYFL